jgi:hypothetical protein
MSKRCEFEGLAPGEHQTEKVVCLSCWNGHIAGDRENMVLVEKMRAALRAIAYDVENVESARQLARDALHATKEEYWK